MVVDVEEVEVELKVKGEVEVEVEVEVGEYRWLLTLVWGKKLSRSRGAEVLLLWLLELLLLFTRICFGLICTNSESHQSSDAGASSIVGVVDVVEVVVVVVFWKPVGGE